MGNTPPISKETLDAKVKAAGCAPDGPLVYALRLEGTDKASSSAREKAMEEIKVTKFAPGTLGDVCNEQSCYSTADRTAAMKLVEAGELMNYAAGYKKGEPGCCTIL